MKYQCFFHAFLTEHLAKVMTNAQHMSDHPLHERQAADRQATKKQMTGQQVSDHRLTDCPLTNPQVTEQSMSDQMSDRPLTDPQMTNRRPLNQLTDHCSLELLTEAQSNCCVMAFILYLCFYCKDVDGLLAKLRQHVLDVYNNGEEF